MKKMHSSADTPAYLKKGDKIALVSTARKISPKELQPAIETIQDWGLEVVLAKHLYSFHNQFSGTDKERQSDFQEMLDNKDINAILCVRGGYGTVRIIDELNFKAFQEQPKWIAGFSDITTLHSHIHNLNISSLHSTMPINFSSNSTESINSLKNALFGKDISIEIKSHPFNRTGQSSAQIVGGNLSILFSLINSKSDIDTNGKILFIEDLDEYLYHIDRMIINFKRSGKLANLKGLIVGGMTKMNDNIVPFGKGAEEIIKEAVSTYSYPVCFNFPAGHVENNRAIKLGQIVNLNVDKKCTLKYKINI